jgi:hypothetical protein
VLTVINQQHQYTSTKKRYPVALGRTILLTYSTGLASGMVTEQGTETVVGRLVPVVMIINSAMDATKTLNLSGSQAGSPTLWERIRVHL